MPLCLHVTSKALSSTLSGLWSVYIVHFKYSLSTLYLCPPGDVVHSAVSQFLLAQATLCLNHQQRGHLEKEGVACKVTVFLQSTYNIHAAALEVIPVLKGVVADFEITSATSHLHRAALLLVGYAVWCVCVCVRVC